MSQERPDGRAEPNDAGAESPLSHALLAAVQARFGERPAAELDEVRDDLRRMETFRTHMMQVPLGNGDEPDFVFVAHASED